MLICFPLAFVSLEVLLCPLAFPFLGPSYFAWDKSITSICIGSCHGVQDSGRRSLTISSPHGPNWVCLPLLGFSFWLVPLPPLQPTKSKGINSYLCLNQSPSFIACHPSTGNHGSFSALACTINLTNLSLWRAAIFFFKFSIPFPTCQTNFLRRQIKLSLINSRGKKEKGFIGWWMVIHKTEGMTEQ